jgi:hypothetical protein
VPVVSTDSLLIFDTELAWAQVLSADGEFGRLIRYRHGRGHTVGVPR